MRVWISESLYKFMNPIWVASIKMLGLSFYPVVGASVEHGTFSESLLSVATISTHDRSMKVLLWFR
jgi:hypothetical protein